MTKLIVVICALALCSCQKAVDHRETGERHCRMRWGESGYSYKLVAYRPYRNSDDIFYACHVNVQGRWVPEENVKVGS